MTFKVEKNEQLWHYECDDPNCNAVSESIDCHDPCPDRLKLWQTEYNGVHFCPEHRLEYPEM
jgi:hypothetical protein